MSGLTFFERKLRGRRQAFDDLTLFVVQFGPGFKTAFMAARTRVFTSHMLLV
jgi:hypothetical protein